MKAATAILVMLTFTVIAVYLAAGDPEPVNAGAVQMPHQAAVAMPKPLTQAGKSQPPVEEMLHGLERRLEQEPDDAKGWNLLGRSYDYLGRSEKAEAAFARAAALGYSSPVAAEQDSVVVRGVVTLDPSFADKIAGTETVFIFARAISGPRMPLAVLRRPVSELPVEFELNDSMAMTTGFRLSGFSEVIIGARISASGDANAGELEGYSGIVKVGNAETVFITVDQSVLKQVATPASEG